MAGWLNGSISAGTGRNGSPFESGLDEYFSASEIGADVLVVIELELSESGGGVEKSEETSNGCEGSTDRRLATSALWNLRCDSALLSLRISSLLRY
jgi:hypothetical protein